MGEIQRNALRSSITIFLIDENDPVYYEKQYQLIVKYYGISPDQLNKEIDLVLKEAQS